MSELPESIRRMSKRLLRLAKDGGGAIHIPNLSSAQDITAQLHGARSTFDALVERASDSPLDTVELALAVGELLGADPIHFVYRYEGSDADPEKEEVVIHLRSDDLLAFEFDADDYTDGEHWNPEAPTVSERKVRRFVASLSFKGCKQLPAPRLIFALAEQLFGRLSKLGGGYAYGYVATGEIQQLQPAGGSQ